MYQSSDILVWWAFIGGVSVIVLLVVAFALLSRWAAPSTDAR